MANIAYVRVSTMEQKDDRQIEALQKFGIDKWFSEKVSGKTTEGREKLAAMLDYMREGDVVFVESFSRLARNTKDLLEIVGRMKEKQVEFRSIKENIDTSTASGKLMLTMLAAIYEFERDCLLERQREGIALAKQKGKYKGRKKIPRPDNWPELFERYRTRHMTGTELAKICKISRSLLYTWLKEEGGKAAE